MACKHALSICSVLLAGLFSLVQCRFEIETGGLKIKLPLSAAQAHQGGFEIALGNFGSPRYGGELLAQLVYVDEGHGHSNQCTPSCKYACQNFSDARPPFKLSPTPGELTNFIMLVDRGPQDAGPDGACKFAQKVWNAQQAGAQGVLVANYEDRLTTMEAPDEKDESAYRFLRNISVPAAFIRESDANVLKQLLQPTASGGQEPVFVIFDWKDVLPQQSQVAWEFWTNSNDQCGALCNVQKEFIKEFVPVAKELESGNWTKFTPHFILWICPVVYRNQRECQSQCIHQGRYCTPDPDGNLKQGYSGKDILQENLRQLCVFQLGGKSGKPWVWWDYVTRFGEQCTMENKQYGSECAERVWAEIGGNNWSTLDALHACIGEVDADVPNAILDGELQRQRGDASTGEVYIQPTIRINGGQYRGKLAYTEVLRAICAAFKDEDKQPPSVCLRVSEDSCRPGSAGDADCKKNWASGRTQCVNTFSDYTCACGQGFMSSDKHDAEGHEVCVKINQCLSAAGQLGQECTCERCACKDKQDSRIGYECMQNIPNECDANNGGCWKDTYAYRGHQREFMATCHDNIVAYKDALAFGRTPPPLHTCRCPPCFEATTGGRCAPKCKLDTCNLDSGGCNSVSTGSGTPSWAVFLIVVGCLGVVAVACYAAYRLRIRSAMHQEIRDIMAQYMPLEDSEGQDPSGQSKPAVRTNGQVVSQADDS